MFDELGSNEIKLDLIDIIAYPGFNITYEKIKNPYNSFGASLFINFSGEVNADWVDNFSLTPFYRFIFLIKKIMEEQVSLLKFFQNFHRENLNILYTMKINHQAYQDGKMIQLVNLILH